MSILIDALLIIIFLSILVFFTKYGLDRALFKIGKTWLAIACALVIGPLITSFLENVFITDFVTNAVHASLIELIEHNANGYNLAELFESMPDNFVNFLDGLGASLTSLEAEFGAYTEASDEIIRTMAERIASPCVYTISSILGLLVGFLIPWLFMKWISYELKKDSRHSFFRVFDYIDGFLTGLALGYAAVIGLSILTRTAFQVVVAFDSSVQVMPIYESSFVFKFLAEFDTIGTITAIFQNITTTIQNVMA